MLRDGALPVLTAVDVLEEFAFPYAKTVHPEKAAQFSAKWNGTDCAREAMEREQIGIRGKDTYYGKQTYGGKNPHKDTATPPKGIPVEPSPIAGQSPKETYIQQNTPLKDVQTAESEARGSARGLSGLFRRGKDAGRSAEKETERGVSARQKGVSVEPDKKKTDKKPLSAKKIDLKSLDEQELKVYNTMKPNVPMSADELVRDDQTISTVMAALTMLEMVGAVEAGKGGYFMRTDPDDAPGRLVEDSEIE